MTPSEIENYVQSHMPSYTKPFIKLTHGTLSREQKRFLQCILKNLPAYLDNPPVLGKKLSELSVQEFLNKTTAPTIQLTGCLALTVLIALLPLILVVRGLSTAFFKFLFGLTWKQAVNDKARNNFLFLLAAHNKIRGRISEPS